VKVVVHSAASAELAAAAEWYEHQRYELGIELLAEVNRALTAISESPHTWPPASGFSRRDVRRFLLSRFPYVVLYCVREAEVLVVAFAHTSRKPQYWRRRLKR